ncbi:hypothetical protein RJJ65_37960, partial [Rhizobium hidalgonense]
ATALLRRRLLPRTQLAPVAAMAVVLCILALGALSPATAERYRAEYAPWWQEPGLLSDEERAVLAAVPGSVAPDEVIAVDPWDGGALAFALSDREVTRVFPTAPMSPDVILISDRLQDIQHDPAVCDAAARENVRYVLDFGDEELWD